MTQKFKHPLKLMIVLGWAIAIFLYSVTPTFAKESRSVTINSNNVRTIRVKLFSPDGKELTNLSPADRQKIMASLAKHLKAAEASMNFLVPGDTYCFNECLGNNGVDPWQVLICGTSCAGWEDPMGRIMCAICLGTDVITVTGCAFQCGALIN